MGRAGSGRESLEEEGELGARPMRKLPDSSLSPATQPSAPVLGEVVGIRAAFQERSFLRDT